MTDAIPSLVAARSEQHGDWEEGAMVANDLMRVLDEHGKHLAPLLSARYLFALAMEFAVRIAL